MNKVVGQIGINTEKINSGLLFQVDPLSNNGSSLATKFADDVVISNDGFMGLGVIAPQYKLHIKGVEGSQPVPLLRIKDGYERKDRVMMYIGGRTKWGDIVPGVAQLGEFGTTGVSLTTTTSDFINVGAHISLGQGVWYLDVSLVIDGTGLSAVPATDYNARLWANLTITEDNVVGASSNISPDIQFDSNVGYVHASFGGLIFPYLDNNIRAQLIINNDSETIKKYYLAVGNFQQVIGTVVSGQMLNVGKFYAGCSLYALKVRMN